MGLDPPHKLVVVVGLDPPHSIIAMGKVVTRVMMMTIILICLKVVAVS